ncbi:MAG: dienelactone hydrolase family protein [Spirochaetales bacterium]|nr:dienelactone hydrolase family protein [Spirochaetales bacterium]
MRTLELSLSIAALLCAAWTFLPNPRKKNGLKFLIGAAVILFILHLLLEGLRWQMTLVYLSLAVLSSGFVLQKAGLFKSAPHSRRTSILLKIVSVIFLIITVLLLWLFPVHKMPVPGGPYKIGTISCEINDDDRLEIYGPAPGGPRRIKFQLWYPADKIEDGKLTKWMTGGRKVTTGIPKMYGVPDFVLAHTALINSNSYKGITVSEKEESFPLVIISHGWTGFMNLHSDLAEMLASNGFIAVSINHTYGALVSVFDNGDVIYADPNALPDKNSVDNYTSYSRALVNTYAQDTALVLNFLSGLNDKPGILENKINMDALGVIGHSTGGGGVVQLAIGDARVKSVFGMDAWVEPIDQIILKKGLQVPSCFLRSEQWETGPNNDSLRQLFSSSKEVPDIYQINGGNHQDFSMLYMYDPMTRLTGSQGSLNSRVNASLQQDWVLTFFDNTLKDKWVDLNQLSEKYEAVVRVRDFK